MADVAGVGAPYWVAARLAATARDDWARFDGWCASTGVDPQELPPDRYLNLVYYWITRRLNDDKRARLDGMLERPPAGEDLAVVDEGTWSAESEMAAFRSVAARAGGSAT